jgi:16S rRNA (cytosine1402-N4)-methyltransferase
MSNWSIVAIPNTSRLITLFYIILFFSNLHSLEDRLIINKHFTSFFMPSSIIVDSPSESQDDSPAPSPHESVLLDEVLSVFSGQSLRVFVDGTLGYGGHAQALLRAHPEIELYGGIDQDPVARGLAAERLAEFGERVRIVPGNARALCRLLKEQGISHIDGMMMDLGVSSMQLDQAEKGFSFRLDGPLDMRMNPEQGLTAAQVVNEWEEAELGRIFREYGEERRWRAAARAVVRARAEGALERTVELTRVLEPVVGRPRRGKVHPVTLIFQALRICVNDELAVVEQVIPAAIQSLRPGGRLAMISFHSLEDRRVKRLFQQAASDKVDSSGLAGLFIDKEPEVKLLTRKPIVPGDGELAQNRRSRSARLRALEKL